MTLTKYTPETLTAILTDRVNDIDCRERIVIKFPFGAQINRVEIYCGETLPDNGSPATAMFGSKLPGITSIQVFTDYSNKAESKSSYSYKKELLRYVSQLVNKMFAAAKETV
jgi:hypothetical protein